MRIAWFDSICGYCIACVVWGCVLQLRRHYSTESPLARKSSQKVKIVSRQAVNAGNTRDCQSQGKQDHEQTSRSTGQITALSYNGSDYPCRKRFKLYGPRWLAYGYCQISKGQGRASKDRRISRMTRDTLKQPLKSIPLAIRNSQRV